ncbi:MULTISPECIES: complex I subunit 4 family protein [Alphaproteobacteria]|jgi:NADH-quinone oxidoreductase subunit M|uniref:NADH-quinone oxidoreductase subunit M n=2 Tax=Roseobacteraceae TaxID=2854170 RepID=A0AAX3LWB3_9RHOB|nr:MULTISPECIES: NADH-quinone oxidoreductase subunit M [Rhodobacterales]MBF53178.1 oxidoreductase [Actibacterium sp.]NVK13985.1 NADH-quinone oxidoreductase subunit M [Paracoccaceae bacterium]OWU66414.1 oxidoreductase [Roseovarius sp. 22II1-1F6A]OWY12046.1 oxidoreductase [Thioclava sp. JM3]WCE72400.1 NADH-quinone oxidoreductase subunit M [Sulfitobacter faviae]|tara:strand:- start:89 stop:1549 length:1461 start_codon:yes stop_codon:yes gene_type:complete
MPLLTIATFLPILAGLALMALPDRSTRTAHAVSIAATGAVFLITLAIWARGIVAGDFAQVEEIAWIPAIGAAYRLGVDGLSLPLVLLTSLLFFLSALYSARIGERAASYVVLMLMLETASLGTFMALDGLLFYVFFEVSLVGMYFMIAGWGYEERQRAALMFFLYTLLGSLPLLLAIIGLYLGSGTFDMRVWVEGTALGGLPAMLALIAMLVTFAVKIPAFPVHTWLPAAHVQAPTAGSVILAGVMLKFGTYGLVRFAYQMTPEAFAQAGQVILAFGVVSALYGAFAALAQSDLKKMIAYTSVNHMGYVVMGVAIAALATEPRIRTIALDGATLQMVSHGLVTGALFFLVGMLQDRAHTRGIGDFGGLLGRVPWLGWAFILSAFASLGLPGLAHFPAEFQIFLATLNGMPWGLIAILAIVITAALYLRAIAGVFLGEMNDKWADMPDLDRREKLVILPLLVLTVLIGVAPGWLIDMIHTTMMGLGN